MKVSLYFEQCGGRAVENRHGSAVLGANQARWGCSTRRAAEGSRGRLGFRLAGDEEQDDVRRSEHRRRHRHACHLWVEAGLHGEVTSATRRLEEDATRALDQTAATRALPSRPGTAVRAAPTPPPPVRREAPVQRRPRQRKRRNPVRVIALLLIAVLALVAIILALALPGGNRQNINRSDVPHQVQDLINYINGHKK